MIWQHVLATVIMFIAGGACGLELSRGRLLPGMMLLTGYVSSWLALWNTQ